MQTVKMVVTGAVGAGKTEFIRSISEIEVVSTERRVTDEWRALKEQTTVAMDFGRITVADDLVLHIFGTPGQARFNFMWEILSQGMLGLVVLVDSTRPETFRETRKIIQFFRSMGEVPYVVAANKQDMPNAWGPEEVKLALRLPDEVPVLPCVATQRQSVKKVVLRLLQRILERVQT